MSRCQISAVLTSLLLLLGAGASPAFAQTECSILVLDGSGSMWGQIDGVAKINIAQRVIGELLDTLPETQELGLSVYGHRRKGDCGDIELVVPPAAGTRDAI
jgi:Ca-activated chloride channel family protein